MPHHATAVDPACEGETILGALKRSDAPILIAALFVAVVRLATLPKGFWEAAEVRFAAALFTFDPFRLAPEPPGYPAYVGAARLFHFFIRDPFLALVILSVTASVLAALLIGRLGARLLGSPAAGAAAAIVVLVSPAYVVFGPLPNAESLALMLVAAAFACFVDRRPDLFAVLAAASIAARPQIALAMIAVVAIGSVAFASRARVLVVFVVALIAMFIPLVEAVGASRFIPWLDIDAELRTDLVLRFIAHPWGGKFLSLPLLALAVAGVAMTLRRNRSVELIALAAFGAIHTATSIVFADALDGVRPVMPAMIATGLFAVGAVARWPIAAVLGALVFASASLAYTRPVIEVRRHTAPAVVARGGIPRGPVVVADPDLAPFVAGSLTPERLDEALGRNPVHIYLLMHGRSDVPGAKHFEWPDSDAFGKLTGGRFRIVSRIPLPPARRFVGRSGVYPYESSPDLGAWRWLAPRASIQLPSSGPVMLRLRLPANAPIESVRVLDRTIRRGETVEVIAMATPSVDIAADRSFRDGDGRALSVQLVGIVRHPR